MCGIFGWDLAQIDKQRLKILAHNLALQNDLRGGHSWGFCADGKIQRGLGDITPHTKHFHKKRRLLAHTRYASTGKVTVKNAHPFHIDKVIGAHNGVIMNHEAMNRRYQLDFQVDSQHIFYHLAHNLDFDELEGWGAIEWFYTTRPERIYLCKLTSNAALGIARCTRVANGIVWSSDQNHLTAALKAAAIEFELIQVDPMSVYFVEKAEVYIASDWKLKLEDASLWRRPATFHWSCLAGTTKTPVMGSAPSGPAACDPRRRSEIDALMGELEEEQDYWWWVHGKAEEDNDKEKSDAAWEQLQQLEEEYNELVEERYFLEHNEEVDEGCPESDDDAWTMWADDPHWRKGQ